MLPEDEENLTKLVEFDGGPICAIALKSESKTAQSVPRAGDIIIFTRGELNSLQEAALWGARSGANLFRRYMLLGKSDGPQAHYVALEIDTPEEAQMRNVVNRLEEAGMLTSEQRQYAYEKLGINEHLHKGSL